MALNQLRKRLILSLRNKDPDVRKVAVREISDSEIPDRYRILENWLDCENVSSIIQQIEEILQNADWFDDNHHKKVESNLNDEQRKVLANLNSSDLETVKKTLG